MELQYVFTCIGRSYEQVKMYKANKQLFSVLITQLCRVINIPTFLLIFKKMSRGIVER